MLSQDEEGRGRIKLMRHNPQEMRDTRRGKYVGDQDTKRLTIAACDANVLVSEFVNQKKMIDKQRMNCCFIRIKNNCSFISNSLS